MEHSVNNSFTIHLAIILKNHLINTLKLFQNQSNYLHHLITEVHLFYNIMMLIYCFALYILVSSCSSQAN